MDLLKVFFRNARVDRPVYLSVFRKNLFVTSLQTGDQADFTYFHPTEADNGGGQDCVVAKAAYGFAWSDVRCTERHHVLCKAAATVTPEDPPGDSPVPFCGDGAHLYRDSACFYVNTTPGRSWAAAQQSCAERGMSLASIHTPEENRFIQDLAGNGRAHTSSVWIGLNDFEEESHYVWSDGTTLDYENLDVRTSRTTANCVSLYLGRTTSGTWRDWDCRGPTNGGFGYACRGPVMFRSPHKLADTHQNGDATAGNSVHHKAAATVTPEEPPEDSPVPFCGDGAHLYRDSACFYVNNTHGRSWAAAQQSCAERGMSLASIHTPEENRFIHDLTLPENGRAKSTWTGLNDL